MQTRFCLAFMVVVVSTGKSLAEDCYDYDEDLKEAINTCETCKKQYFEKAEISKCILEKEGLLDQEDSIDKETIIEYYLKGFKGDDKKKASIKKGLEECLKEEPATSAEFEKLDQCMDDVVIQFCPEAEDKIKEAKENELLKSCY